MEIGSVPYLDEVKILELILYKCIVERYALRMPIPAEFVDTITLESYEIGTLRIPDGAIDLILTDPPYGVTDCPWDTKPDLEFMWKEFLRILKPNGAAVVTATQPFATDLINSNRKWFRYDLVWVKSNPGEDIKASLSSLNQHINDYSTIGKFVNEHSQYYASGEDVRKLY